jgi:hypothetical protein
MAGARKRRRSLRRVLRFALNTPPYGRRRASLRAWATTSQPKPRKHSKRDC